jgi:hypothetical protein
MLTLLYETRDGRGFRLHQRLRVVPLREELRITGQDARELPSRGRELYLVQGAYVSGEPIDGMHRHRTREVLTWESGEVIGELEYRIGVDAPTAEMLAIAHSMTTRRRGERATRRSRRAVGAWRRLLH